MPHVNELDAGRSEVRGKGVDQTLERTGILLQVDQRARVDLPMQVGQTQQVVAVQGNVTNLDTFSSTVKDVVDSTRMTELPLNGRNALSLQALLPGAVPTASGSAASGACRPTGGAGTGGPDDDGRVAPGGRSGNGVTGPAAGSTGPTRD